MKINESTYQQFLEEIKGRIQRSQYQALRQVNKELINLYWEIGRLIVDRQKEHGWGKSIVEKLSNDLQSAYPGVKGYSASNLWRMRNLFQTYKGNEKLAPLVREIGWSHNIVVMEKVTDALGPSHQ